MVFSLDSRSPGSSLDFIIYSEARIGDFMQKKVEYSSQFPMLDAFIAVPATGKPCKPYKEKKDLFKSFVENKKKNPFFVNNGITELFFHPTVDMSAEELIMGRDKWCERVYEGRLFSDPEIIQFFHDKQIIFTNWKEMMRRYKARKKAGKI